MHDRRLNRRNTGWPHTLFLIFLAVGILFAVEDDDRGTPEVPPGSSCEGTPYDADVRGAADALAAQGWHVTGTRLYPPHCR